MIKKIITILCVFIIMLSGSVFAESAIIYAPIKNKEVDNVLTPENNIMIQTSNIQENQTQLDYTNIYELYEDNNNHLYCLNLDGSKTINAWRKISKSSFERYGDTDAFNHDYIWAYFDSNGRIIKSTGTKIKKQQIGYNTYAFNEYGQMLEGYFNENGEMWNWNSGDDPLDLNDDSETYLYYADPETGILKSGWHRFLENTDKYENKEKIWLYFDPKNFRSSKAKGNTYKLQEINGKKYAFDNLGVMLTGFETMRYNEESGGTISQIKYFNSDGSIAANGFVSIDLNNEVNEQRYEDYLDYGDDITIYLNKNGIMYKDQMRKINNKYYGFDKKGVVLKNCLSIWNNGKYVDTISPEDTDGYDFITRNTYQNKLGESKTYTSGQIFYFDNTGKRQDTGNITFGGEVYTYKGSGSGAYNGLKSKKFYVHGLLMKPIDGKYGIYLMDAGNTTYNTNDIYGNPKAFVVNKSGSKQSSTTTGLKDSDDNYWLIGSNSTLIGIYDVKVKRSGNKLYYYNDDSKWIEFDGNSHRVSLSKEYCLNFRIN